MRSSGRPSAWEFACFPLLFWLILTSAPPRAAQGQAAEITVQTDQPGHRISRYLTGACIEDVNHEIYGGLYSQMIFGEIYFDLHVGTDGPRPDSSFSSMFTFIEALGRIADGAPHKVAVFEFNAGNHTHRRALANALAINAIERHGRIPVATSANCLQPDGQNDNGWDQGLLFLNPSQAWLQPPGWVTRMISRHYQPLHVPTIIRGSDQLE